MGKFSVVIFAICCALSASAQTTLHIGDKSITIGDPAPKDKIIALFGKPQNFWAHDDEAAGGYLEVYVFDRMSISVVDGLVWDFAVDDPDCEVVIHNRYRVRIGDSYVAFINSIPLAETIRHRLGSDRVKLHFKIAGMDAFSDEALVISYDESGNINSLSWHVPD